MGLPSGCSIRGSGAVRRALASALIALAVAGAGPTGVAQAQDSAAYTTYKQAWRYAPGAASADPARAANLFAESSAAGFVPAKTALAWLYQTGQGVPADPARAASMLKEAAAAGHADAAFMLGMTYLNGVGVGKNLHQAAVQLAAAAAAGHQRAQMALAVYYSGTKGVKPNKFTARRWYARAASGPDAELAAAASQAVARLDKELLFSGPLNEQELAMIMLIGYGLLNAVGASSSSPEPYLYEDPCLKDGIDNPCTGFLQ